MGPPLHQKMGRTHKPTKKARCPPHTGNAGGLFWAPPSTPWARTIVLYVVLEWRGKGPLLCLMCPGLGRRHPRWRREEEVDENAEAFTKKQEPHAPLSPVRLALPRSVGTHMYVMVFFTPYFCSPDQFSFLPSPISLPYPSTRRRLVHVPTGELPNADEYIWKGSVQNNMVRSPPKSTCPPRVAPTRWYNKTFRSPPPPPPPPPLALHTQHNPQTLQSSSSSSSSLGGLLPQAFNSVPFSTQAQFLAVEIQQGRTVADCREWVGGWVGGWMS